MLSDKSSLRTNLVACIPAFNEERAIAGVIIGVQTYVGRVIVCDDGSSDRTSEIATRMGAEVVRHKTNQGYGAALATLFEKCRRTEGEVFVVIDGDGQHDPADIPRLTDPIVK